MRIRPDVLVAAIAVSSFQCGVRSNDATNESQADGKRVVAATACGRPPLPKCALQEWMDARLALPLANQQIDRMPKPLDALALAGPEGYPGWREAAMRGAAAARRGNRDEIRRACGDCHAAHRARFRRELSTRLLSPELRRAE